MSIGKRLVNLLRANVNAVIDKASGAGGGAANIEDLSEHDLEKELELRRKRREAADRAAQAGHLGVDEAAWQEMEDAMGSERYRTTSRRRVNFGRQPSGMWAPGQFPGRDPKLARLYAQLECPYGADVDVVRKHYRAMMRKYHPDMHSTNPEKQRVATELTQKLTQAYNDLKKLLTPRTM